MPDRLDPVGGLDPRPQRHEEDRDKDRYGHRKQQDPDGGGGDLDVELHPRNARVRFSGRRSIREELT